LSAFVFSPGSPATGIKMVTRFTNDGVPLLEQTTYWEADRERTENRSYSSGNQGPRLASIKRCDLGEEFELNLDAKEYTSGPYPPKPVTAGDYAKLGLKEPVQSDKPAPRVEITTVDTGDRKDFFGHVARHFVTTIRQTPVGGSHSQSQENVQESVTDGWYIDFDPTISCGPKVPKGTPAVGVLLSSLNGGPIDRPEFITRGDPPATGFHVRLIVDTKSTYVLPNGIKQQRHLRNESQVTEMEERPLDPGLFEIPAGFKDVQQIQQNPKVNAQANAAAGWWNEVKLWLAEKF
jgi:hypothetical protein